jgi:hypothetical protein
MCYKDVTLRQCVGRVWDAVQGGCCDMAEETGMEKWGNTNPS